VIRGSSRDRKPSLSPEVSIHSGVALERGINVVQTPAANLPSRSPFPTSLSPTISMSQEGSGAMSSGRDDQPSIEDLVPNDISVHPGSMLERDIVIQNPPPNLLGRDSIGILPNFNWNFGYFEGINESLDVLNRAGGVNAQLDQLLNTFLSDADHDFPMGISQTSKSDPEDGLFRIPTSNEVPIAGMHSAPPPTKNVWRKLTDSRWAELVLELAAMVSSIQIPSDGLGRNI
jgi:hypothetical protein